MPKQKSNRAAAKRFKVTASGHYKHKAANRNHILTKKSSKRKRQLATNPLVHKRDERAVRRMLLDE